jgi:hypothetical protein
MNSEAWFEDFQMLCNRFSHLGMGADPASLPRIEQWGLYLKLSRLAEDE